MVAVKTALTPGICATQLRMLERFSGTSVGVVGGIIVQSWQRSRLLLSTIRRLLGELARRGGK